MPDKVGFENPGQHPNIPNRVYASDGKHFNNPAPLPPVPPLPTGGQYGSTDPNQAPTDGKHFDNVPATPNQQVAQPDVSTLSPDELATLLGTTGYAPSYSSNDKGSFERNYNALLNTLSPDQMLKRYGTGQTSQYMTEADRANYQAFNSFKSLFGRPPSQNELAQVIPAFQGPNGAMNGNAYLASLQQLYKSNPAADPNSQQNNQNPNDVQSSVAQQFKSVLGRDATPDELAHFSQAIQTGQTDAYGLSSFLKQMPEYTNAQDSKFRQGLSSELESYDTREFNKEKEGVMADYAKRGMNMGSSPSLDYALTDLMGNIASNRSAYLSQLSASQYGGNKDLAVGNYQNSLNQMYSQNQGQRQNQNAYTQQLLNQGFQGADYSSQMKDYMNFMGNNSGGGGGNPLYGMAGGALGAGIGAFAGGPTGASAGWQIGSGLGNSYGYLNR